MSKAVFSFRMPFFVVCPLGQKWAACGAQCTKTCDNFHLPCLETNCRGGCICPEGTVLHGQRCVNSSQCLCHHGGHSYRPGQKIKVDCNTWYVHTGNSNLRQVRLNPFFFFKFYFYVI